MTASLALGSEEAVKGQEAIGTWLRASLKLGAETKILPTTGAEEAVKGQEAIGTRLRASLKLGAETKILPTTGAEEAMKGQASMKGGAAPCVRLVRLVRRNHPAAQSRKIERKEV